MCVCVVEGSELQGTGVWVYICVSVCSVIGICEREALFVTCT